MQKCTWAFVWVCECATTFGMAHIRVDGEHTHTHTSELCWMSLFLAHKQALFTTLCACVKRERHRKTKTIKLKQNGKTKTIKLFVFRLPMELKCPSLSSPNVCFLFPSKLRFYRCFKFAAVPYFAARVCSYNTHIVTHTHITPSIIRQNARHFSDINWHRTSNPRKYHKSNYDNQFVHSMDSQRSRIDNTNNLWKPVGAFDCVILASYVRAHKWKHIIFL